MSEWRIEYDNDTGPDDEGFHEWWTVTDGSKSFRCDTESDANFLFDRLSEWKPIETAPKDGTPVDLWAKNLLTWNKRGERLVNRKWGPVLDWANQEREGWAGVGDAYEPTHWMPLPAPPVTD